MSPTITPTPTPAYAQPAPCNCGCPNCQGSRAVAHLGFVDIPSGSTTSNFFASIDFTDWKTWALIALAAALAYQLFFSEEKRVKRTRRRQAIRSARDRYERERDRIEERA